MRAIDARIQGRWLRRRGLRGRWITVYVHRYGGQESTERLHSHPWAVAFEVVLRGRLLEVVGVQGNSPRRRGFLSVGMYRRGKDRLSAFGEQAGFTVRVESVICMLGADELYARTAAKPEVVLGFKVSSTAVWRPGPVVLRRSRDGKEPGSGSRCSTSWRVSGNRPALPRHAPSCYPTQQPIRLRWPRIGSEGLT